MVGGEGSEDELRLLVLEGGEIRSVEFKYLGSVVDGIGGLMKEVGERITSASIGVELPEAIKICK